MEKIPQSEYESAVGDFKRQVGMTLNVFNIYGLGEYIPGVCGEIVTLAEQFAMQVRGKKIKIQTRDKPRERGIG
jgi:hypothetical protein